MAGRLEPDRVRCSFGQLLQLEPQPFRKRPDWGTPDYVRRSVAYSQDPAPNYCMTLTLERNCLGQDNLGRKRMKRRPKKLLFQRSFLDVSQSYSFASPIAQPMKSPVETGLFRINPEARISSSERHRLRNRKQRSTGAKHEKTTTFYDNIQAQNVYDRSRAGSRCVGGSDGTM